MPTIANANNVVQQVFVVDVCTHHPQPIDIEILPLTALEPGFLFLILFSDPAVEVWFRLSAMFPQKDHFCSSAPTGGRPRLGEERNLLMAEGGPAFEGSNVLPFGGDLNLIARVDFVGIGPLLAKCAVLLRKIEIGPIAES